MRFILLLCLLPVFTNAQLGRGYFSGFVKDNAGHAMSGEMVYNLQTGQLMYSANEGFYEIPASAGDTIQIFIGRKFVKNIIVRPNQLHAVPLTNLPVSEKPVNPVISDDYANLIKRDSLHNGTAARPDSTPATGYTQYRLTGRLNPEMKIKNMRIAGNRLTVKPRYTKHVFISGLYSVAWELKSANRLPSLQKTYTQGRSINGKPEWQGPATNEIFSYGPPTAQLEFDGSKYDWDQYGQLVQKDAGNGMPARNYDNSIFRSAGYFTQSLNLQGYLNSRKWDKNFTVKLANAHENLIMRGNENAKQSIEISGNANITGLEITAAYQHHNEKFSNSNRAGFLNRVYQQSLLTPVSFSNAQGYTIGNMQRSYSSQADNPFFLLNNPANGFRQSSDLAYLKLNKRISHFIFDVLMSAEQVGQHSSENYKPGTAFFENGSWLVRSRKSVNEIVRSSVTYRVDYGSYNVKSNAIFNYNYTNNHTVVRYKPADTYYHYQRSAHDVSYTYFTTFSTGKFEGSLNLGNKFYFSNTSPVKNLWLPLSSAAISYNFGHGKGYIKLAGSYNSSRAELPLDCSVAGIQLLDYPAGQTGMYLPMQELATMNSITPQKVADRNISMEVSLFNIINLTAEFFTSETKGEIYPVTVNGLLSLVNMCDSRSNGTEFNFSMNTRGRKVKNTWLASRISYFSSHTLVTAVKPGYDQKPVAGFSQVYKAIVKGQSPGVIMGNYFLRNDAGQLIIGTEGFPLASTQPGIIGDPTPDFTMKFNNTLHIKDFSFNADLEWRKGGDVWNGTAAMLDYYGRSAYTGIYRNVSGYIYPGVLQNGQPNTIPVSFYDPALPVEKNRWTRYGPSGVAEAYIQKGDFIRINNLSVSYKWKLKKYPNSFRLSVYLENLFCWSAYPGADPDKFLFDQPGTSGLDYFNLPSAKKAGITATLQF